MYCFSCVWASLLWLEIRMKLTDLSLSFVKWICYIPCYTWHLITFSYVRGEAKPTRRDHIIPSMLMHVIHLYIIWNLIIFFSRFDWVKLNIFFGFMYTVFRWIEQVSFKSSRNFRRHVTKLKAWAYSRCKFWLLKKS